MKTTRRVTLVSLAVGTALFLVSSGARAKPQESGDRRTNRASPAPARSGGLLAKKHVANSEAPGALDTADAPTPPPPPVVAKKVDALEAALAQAMSTTELPRADKKVVQPTAQTPAMGLEGLSRRALRSRSVSLGARARSRSVPQHEEVVRFDVQPLDQRVVRALIAEKAPQLHYCHERAAGPGRAPTGTVTLEFVVEPRGHVSKVDVVTGDRSARELEQCLERRIRTWRFPAADAPTFVDYSLAFDVAGSVLGSTEAK